MLFLRELFRFQDEPTGRRWGGLDYGAPSRHSVSIGTTASGEGTKATTSGCFTMVTLLFTATTPLHSRAKLPSGCRGGKGFRRVSNTAYTRRTSKCPAA